MFRSWRHYIPLISSVKEKWQSSTPNGGHLYHTYSFAPKLPAPGHVLVQKEVLVKAGLSVVCHSMTGCDSQQVDTQLVQRVAQQLTVVVDTVGRAEMWTIPQSFKIQHMSRQKRWLRESYQIPLRQQTPTVHIQHFYVHFQPLTVQWVPRLTGACFPQLLWLVEPSHRRSLFRWTLTLLRASVIY